MAEPKTSDRIEITKKLEGMPDWRILERTIHNPNMADIGDIFRRLHAAKIFEIAEAQEHSPVYEGQDVVVDYVPTGHRRVSFLILENK